MAELEIRSPVTGDELGTVVETDVGAAAEAAALVQPLSAAVPARARANSLRRAAQAVLDGAPVDAAASGALWAAFAGAGRHPAAVGRLIVAPGPAEALL
jgi:acyl-CoA reductase-like NAD-dependent aldehyde dehydrogenase